MIALVLGSRTFQISVGRCFATGDLSIVDNDFFSQIVEKLLLLTPQNRKGAPSACYSLTLDIGKSITTALDGALSALPLKFVSGIVETFVKTKRDVLVTSKMISIASDRLTRVLASDVALKSSLTQLLSLMSQVIQSADDTDATEVALECIAKLSRVHGKAELPVFEQTLPVIVANGVGSTSDVTVQNSLSCLLSLLYAPHISLC